MIHLYWHTDPPEDLLRTRDEWREVVGEDIIEIWTPAELPDLVSRAEASCEGVAEVDHVRHVANVVRWHVLNEHGGLWADTDVWPLRRPNGYLSRLHPWCAALGSVPTPFMCGGPAHDDLWQRTLDAALDHPQGTSPYASGGRLLQTVAMPNDLELVPASFFAGRDASGRLLPPPVGGRFSLHEWKTSSTRYSGAQP